MSRNARLPLVAALALPSLLVGLGACSDSSKATDGGSQAEDLTKLTTGVTLQPAGCGYSVTTPNETTAPFADPDALDGPMQAPRSLHVSFVGDPSTSATIVWLTDIPTRNSRVEWGAAATYGQTARGFSFTYPTDIAGNDPPSVRVHEVQLCGLTPATTYHYRVGAPGTTSTDATFTTAPQAAGAPLRFVVAGDSRGNAGTWGMVVANAAKLAPDFILYTGDAVDLGTLQSAWDDWFAAAMPSLPSIPLMFAMGNHEISARHVFSQMALPGNEQWYSFDYGDVHVVVLDDTPVDNATITGDQATFLDADLAKTTKKWKLVMHHKAIYSSSMHGSQAALQAAWMPTYDKYAVDVVFNGHDHDYERTVAMKGGQPAADGKSGTTYFVNGGGGADLYPSGKSVFTAFSKSTYSYLVVDVMGGKMTLTAWELAGGAPTQLDQVVLTK